MQFLRTIGQRQQAFRAPGHFGHGVCAKMADDAIERGHDRRQRGEHFDHLVAHAAGQRAQHGITVDIEHRA